MFEATSGATAMVVDDSQETIPAEPSVNEHGGIHQEGGSSSSSSSFTPNQG